MKVDKARLKDFLDRKVEEYNRPSFIVTDPIAVAHLFSKKQDIEIAGLFASTFAWGNRTTIIQKGRQLMELMDNSPHQFVSEHQETDLKRFEGFCHRTFNTTDLLYFISFLQHHYSNSKSLESAFTTLQVQGGNDMDKVREPIEKYLNTFHHNFFALEYAPPRTRKHVAAPYRNSACKRLNMFLRWMVRKDGKGVDFGLWKQIKPSDLICPLDLHVARVAKRFQLLDRPKADWLSAVELTQNLRTFDRNDPARYDFALFALGVNEKF